MEYNLEYGGMIVNKKLFDEAGLSYPETWEELRQISQDVSVSNGDLVEMEGFEMLDSDSLICNYLAMILQQGGQYHEEDDSINFATPEGVKAMEEILSMVDNGEADLENLANDEYCFNDVYQDKGYMASSMRSIFNQMFLDLCDSSDRDIEGALKTASEQITSECKISYSTK